MTEMATQTTLINESHNMSSSGKQIFTTGETESESNKNDVDVIPQPASLDNVAQVLRAAFINARQSIAACNEDKRQIISSNDDCMENEDNDDEDDEDTSVLRTLSSQSGVSKGLQHYLLPSLHQVCRLQTSIAKQKSPLKVIQPLVPKPSTSSCLDEDEEFALSVLNGPFIDESSNKKQIESKSFRQGTISTLGSRIAEVKIPIPIDEKIKSDIVENVSKIIENKQQAKIYAQDYKLLNKNENLMGIKNKAKIGNL
jgi:hypothetical protein